MCVTRVIRTFVLDRENLFSLSLAFSFIKVSKESSTSVSGIPKTDDDDYLHSYLPDI